MSYDRCFECGVRKTDTTEGPILKCLECTEDLCFLCVGRHLDSHLHGYEQEEEQ